MNKLTLLVYLVQISLRLLWLWVRGLRGTTGKMFTVQVPESLQRRRDLAALVRFWGAEVLATQQALLGLVTWTGLCMKGTTMHAVAPACSFSEAVVNGDTVHVRVLLRDGHSYAPPGNIYAGLTRARKREENRQKPKLSFPLCKQPSSSGQKQRGSLALFTPQPPHFFQSNQFS